MQYWLMKSEPDDYSIDDLKKDKTTLWTGVRNYQARNFMREMEVGDKVLFYHSNAGTETGVVGEMEVSKTVVPDPLQFRKGSNYFDEKATPDNPRWECVEVSFSSKNSNVVTLNKIKTRKQFSDMKIVEKGNRLSITPVKKAHYQKIVELGT